MSTTQVVVFLFHADCVVFLLPRETMMDMKLIKNTDTSMCLAYKIARIVYAETGARTLPGVEALTSMIKNLSDMSGQSILDIIQDSNMFTVLKSTSPNHERLFIHASDNAFQMCVRVALRMLRGGLPDTCYGAVRFHHSNTIPDWAMARGYIADIDGMLFYQWGNK